MTSHPPLAGLLARLRRGEAGADEMLAAARERVEALAGERVLRHRFEAAGERDRAWWGVAYLTKANLAVLDEPLDCCSRILEGFRAPYEATVTARLRTAGATCLGATNMDEFAMGSSGETSVDGPPAHPFLPGRVCGGSSSGAAAAVARRVVPFALGSDTGGSVRQPAAYCGLVGLKPSRGRVSRHGLVAHASSLDTVGVLALRVRDARLVLEIIEGSDGFDATLLGDLPPLSARAPRAVALLRTGPERLDEATARAIGRTAEGLREDGTRVESVELPGLDAALGAYTVLAAAESASNLARYDGSLYGARVEAATWDESVRRTRSRGFGPEVKLRILLGTEVLRKGHTEDALRRARRVVSTLSSRLAELFADHDALLLPTVPGPAFAVGTRTGDPLAMREADRFTVLASLLGLPAVSVPVGEDDEGAPLAAQCIAPRGEDGRALALAEWIEEHAEVARLQDEHWWPRTPEGAR